MSLALVTGAVTALQKGGRGVSRSAIVAHLGTKATLARINVALKKAVDGGKITQTKESFKLCAAAKATGKAAKPPSKVASKTTKKPVKAVKGKATLVKVKAPAKAGVAKPTAVKKPTKIAPKSGKAKAVVKVKPAKAATKGTAKAAAKPKVKPVKVAKVAKVAAKPKAVKAVTAKPAKPAAKKVAAKPKASKAKAGKIPGGAMAIGVVDPMSGLSATGIVFHDGTGLWDCMLNELNLATNTDKYYGIQVIKDATTGNFYCFQHWGRTGTSGQSHIDGPSSEQDACDVFKAKFHDKTGSDWVNRASFKQQAGKYDLLKTDYTRTGKKGRWQYFMNESNHWLDYDPDASDIVETVYENFLANPHLGVRCVHSGSWTYQVDLTQMHQTNMEHVAHTRRAIRRVP